MTTNYLSPAYYTFIIPRATLAANPDGISFGMNLPYQVDRLKLKKICASGVQNADSGNVWFLIIDDLSTTYFTNVRSEQVAGNNYLTNKKGIPIFIHDLTNNSFFDDLNNPWLIGSGQLINDQKKINGVKIVDRNGNIPTFTEIIITLEAEIQPVELLKGTANTRIVTQLRN